MLDRLRHRLTYANVTATLALFVALGGTSYAVVKLPAHSVGTRELADGSVTAAKLRPGAVTSRAIRDGAVRRWDLGTATRQGDPGAKGDAGATGAQGPAGAPAQPDLDAPTATDAQANAATFSFGGLQRVAIGQQPTRAYDLNPGAGLVEVASGDGRVSQFTHYQYGTTIRSRGKLSNIMELWLGDDGTGQPNFSVRGWSNHFGALVQARNGTDTSGLQLDFLDPFRPRLAIEDNGMVPGATLAIENPEADGTITLATKLNGRIVDRLVVEPDGTIRIPSGAELGAGPDDPVRLHGTTGSGHQGQDPGALDDVTAADVGTPEAVAARIDALGRVANALRDALLAHGLIG